MSANTPVSSLPYAQLSDSPNANTLSQGIATALDHLVLPKYASTAARDAANPSPVEGDECYVTSKGRYRRMGSTWYLDASSVGWTSWTPTWSTSTATHLPTTGNGVYACFYLPRFKAVDFVFSFTTGTTSSYNGSATTSDNWTWTFPVGFTPSTTFNAWGFGATSSGANNLCTRLSSTTAGFISWDITGARSDLVAISNMGLLDGVTPSAGWWTTGCTIRGGGTYQLD